jgi:hypothetical protein
MFTNWRNLNKRRITVNLFGHTECQAWTFLGPFYVLLYKNGKWFIKQSINLKFSLVGF